MKNVLRPIAVMFVLVAAFAVASAPAASNSVVYAEGSAPVPLCMPGTDCTPVTVNQEGSAPVPLCMPGTDCTPVR